MNHNPVAMAMHAVNHPRTLHYPEDIFSVDPKISTGGLPVLLGWFSPDCRHFSKAKGGTPVRKEIRGLAWVVLRWALAVRPRYLMLENVEEFRSWGPLKADKKGNLYPDPAYTGETFRSFIGMLSSGVAPDCPALAEACEFLQIDVDSDDARRLVDGLGYNVDHKELRACDYGAPTIRKRLFVVSRCDGEAVVWPDPSHGAPDSAEVLAGQLQPYRTAAECIDWSIPTRSIMGRKKPLADNTLRRIVKGLKRYVIDCPDPYIVQIGQTGFGGDGRQYATGTPLTTVTSKAEHLLIEPFAVKCNHTSNRTKYDCFRGSPAAFRCRRSRKPMVSPWRCPWLCASLGTAPASVLMRRWARSCLAAVAKRSWPVRCWWVLAARHIPASRAASARQRRPSRRNRIPQWQQPI